MDDKRETCKEPSIFKSEYLDEIGSIIIECYMDKYLLESLHQIGEWDVNDEFLFHISYIARMDFAVNIYKIYFDINKNANTINRLVKEGNRYLNGQKNIELIWRNKETEKQLKKLGDKLKKFRNTFAAHLDRNHSNETIEVSELVDALEYIKKLYNSICDKNIINDSKRIEEQNLLNLECRCKLKTGLILGNRF